MGVYLNPGNELFRSMLNSEYIDKTGMISIINNSIETDRRLTCISRPRRFGKSYAARMLSSYYDKSCDSYELFSGLSIASDISFRKHLNKYDVIYLDITQIMAEAGKECFIEFIKDSVKRELKAVYTELDIDRSFTEVLLNVVELSGNKFVFIIDEWDAPIRETSDKEKDYLHFLRMLFKSSSITPRIVAAAYMTGILPIKKDGSQSAISDFKEYTMISPGDFAEYIGFTEDEVKTVCHKHGADFVTMKNWYDGYSFKDVGSIYNPNSVMEAIHRNSFESYWTQTSSADSLLEYIGLDYSGLSRTVAELIGGVDVGVETLGFSNDMTSFKNKDDILTLLIHFGYLAYNSDTHTAYIPNEEIRKEFQRAVRDVKHGETIRRLKESDQLFKDTLEMNEEAVASCIEKIHREETSPIHYNREDSLRSVIKLAYYTYRDNYLQWEELPSGDGYADVVYLPLKDSDKPALVIELKWNDSTNGAIGQILEKHYPDSLRNIDSDILLVGINYDKNSRKHSCKIVRIDNSK